MARPETVPCVEVEEPDQIPADHELPHHHQYETETEQDEVSAPNHEPNYQQNQSLYRANISESTRKLNDYNCGNHKQQQPTRILPQAESVRIYARSVSYSMPPFRPRTEVPWPDPQSLHQGNVGSQSQVWSSGLFDCFNDPVNALVTAVFPCLTFGQVAEIVNHGYPSCRTRGILYGISCCLIGMPWIMSCTYRTRLRSEFGLPESPAPDCITHFFCEYCAVCQEYRELKSRGRDPSIGWHGNLNLSRRSNQQTTTSHHVFSFLSFVEIQAPFAYIGSTQKESRN